MLGTRLGGYFSFWLPGAGAQGTLWLPPNYRPQRTWPIGVAPGILGIWEPLPLPSHSIHPGDLTPFRLDPLSHPINIINISKSSEFLGPPQVPKLQFTSKFRGRALSPSPKVPVTLPPPLSSDSHPKLWSRQADLEGSSP